LIESEAAIAREVFERYAAGESQRTIARDLTHRGILSPGGGRWMVSALHEMLHNERYIGLLVWNRTQWRKHPDTGRRTCVERPRAEWITTERPDLRIVSDETWARVRARDTPAAYGSQQARPKYTHGNFPPSAEIDERILEARCAVADLLGA
jgi:site-specific DNA recombinase